MFERMAVVEWIADDRPAHVCELCAELMFSSGFKSKLEHGDCSAAGQSFPVGDGALAAFAIKRGPDGSVDEFDEVVVDGACVGVQVSVDDCVIGPLGGFVSELSLERGECLGVE